MSALDDRVQTLADSVVAGERAPHGVVIAVDRGSDVSTAAAGIARADTREPLSADQPFHVASVGKMCTAAMTLQATEAGAFPHGLTTTLSDLGAAGLLHPRLATGAHPAADRVTIAHLLTHTSGMKDMQSDDATGTAEDHGGMPAPQSVQGRFWADVMARATGGGDGFSRHRWAGWDATQPDDPMAGMLNRFLATGTAATPVAAPGERFHYSDTAYVLLATVLEAVHGVPYHEVQRRDVLAPLGMAHTYQAYVDDPTAGARASEMDVWGGPHALVSSGADLSFDWGGGGQVSTVADLCRLVRGFLGGTLFRDPRTLARATDWIAPPGLSVPRVGVGLGLHRWLIDGHELVGHSGAWGVRAFLEPATGVVVASTVGRRDDCPWYPAAFGLVAEG